MRIELVDAEGVDFLQYPHISIELDKQGLVFLSGSLEHNRSRSNSAGKTAALSLVSWILWGRILKDTRDVTGVIRYECSECSGTLKGRIDGAEFAIKRTRTKSGSTLYASFAGSSRTQDVQNEINDVFGTFDLAQNTVFLAQRKALEFLSATDSDRRKILEELLKIGVWREAQDRVKEDIDWAKDKESTLRRELQDAAHGKEALETEIRHARELATSDLRSVIRIHQENIDDKQSVLPSLKNTYESLQEAYEKKHLHEDKVHTNLLLSAEAELRVHRRELHTLEQESASDAREYRRLKEGGNCPTCRQPVPPHDEAVINGAHKRMTESSLALTEKATVIKNQEAIVDRSRLVALKHQENCYMKRQELVAARDAFVLAEESIRSSRSKVEEARRQLEEVQASLAKDSTEKIAQYDHVIKTRTESLDELDRGRKAMEFWKEGFSFKGIPSMLISESLPLLVKNANHVLRILSDDELSLDILPADAKRDGKSLMEKLTFLVSKDGREVYMEDCSAGEQRRIVISIFLALARMQSVLTGISWNVRLVDELFDELDDHGIERVMRVLREMSSDHTILVTSHRSSLRDLDGFDQKWTVLRKHTGSVLIKES